MLNFTVGPVQMCEEVCRIGEEQVPYFRTQEFSKIMKENENLMKKFTGAGEKARVLFLTGSGTASMEAAIMNTLTQEDKALVINGGSFGQRFVDLCQIYEVPYTEIKLYYGQKLRKEMLEKYTGDKYTCLIVNVHETSTGVHYDLNMLHEFCQENHLFFIVDAISSFLADPIDMEKQGIDVLITGSQKALAVPPGISILTLSKKAINRIENNHVKSLYFDLKLALKNGERGQTPFTPAVSILRQIHQRLLMIDENGGANSEISRVHELAIDFRNRIKNLPVDIFSEEVSNAVTALKTRNVSAKKIFDILKDEYQIWICPNGGELSEKVFRVGHIGNLTITDNTVLIEALDDLVKRKILI